MPGATSDDELSLRRSSSSYHFTSNNKAWLWACVESEDILAFHFILHFLLDGIFIEPLDKALWSTSTFWLPLRWQLNSWWEIPSLTFNDLNYHWQPPYLLSNTCWSCLGYTLVSLLFLQSFFEYFLWFSTPAPTCNTKLMLPRSMTEVFRISTMNIGSTLSNVSWSIIQTPLYG